MDARETADDGDFEDVDDGDFEDVDDRRFEDVDDGCGCTEIWEHLSEQRGD